MSSFISSPLPDDFELLDFAKEHQGLGLFNSPSDVLAPHPDQFESELDSNLAAFDQLQLQLLTFDYPFLRSDTPTCGPPSTFTLSSDSAYDSLSSHSESYYNYPHSPYSPTNYSFPLDLDMDFQKFRVDAVSDYAAVNSTQSSNGTLPTTVDPTSFGTLPPTPPHSPPVPSIEPFDSSFSDYGPPSRSAAPDYYTQLSYNPNAMATVSPSRVSAQLPLVPRPRPSSDDGHKGDPRKKYKCTSCPRGDFLFLYSFLTRPHTAIQVLLAPTI